MSQLDMCYAIKASVGLGGKNNPEDVEIVQELLIENDLLPEQPVSYDLLRILQAIERFQSGFMLHADGKVDPHGTTFERLQGLGLEEMPAGGGPGWYRYETGDLNKSRIMHFGTANTVQAVREVAHSVACGMPGWVIGIGDLSSAMGTNLGRHQTHLHGLNVDVRPLRKDGARQPTNIHDTQNYSQEYTLLLVDAFLAHKNVERILFNDPQIIHERQPRVHSSQGHDNHLHVIMRS
jgi:hypothetical protein